MKWLNVSVGYRLLYYAIKYTHILILINMQYSEYPIKYNECYIFIKSIKLNYKQLKLTIQKNKGQTFISIV